MSALFSVPTLTNGIEALHSVIVLLRCDSGDRACLRLPRSVMRCAVSAAFLRPCPRLTLGRSARQGMGTALGSGRAAPRPRRRSPVRDDRRARDTLCSLAARRIGAPPAASSPAAGGRAASCHELAAAADPLIVGSAAAYREPVPCGLVARVAAPGTPSGEPKNGH